MDRVIVRQLVELGSSSSRGQLGQLGAAQALCGCLGSKAPRVAADLRSLPDHDKLLRADTPWLSVSGMERFHGIGTVRRATHGDQSDGPRKQDSVDSDAVCGGSGPCLAIRHCCGGPTAPARQIRRQSRFFITPPPSMPLIVDALLRRAG